MRQPIGPKYTTLSLCTLLRKKVAPKCSIVCSAGTSTGGSRFGAVMRRSNVDTHTPPHSSVRERYSPGRSARWFTEKLAILSIFLKRNYNKYNPSVLLCCHVSPPLRKAWRLSHRSGGGICPRSSRIAQTADTRCLENCNVRPFTQGSLFL